mgnify:CR=1 FL=1
MPAKPTIEDMMKHACDAASLLKQLANENRLVICCTLAEEELSVGELNERIPLSQSALSQHLAKLRTANIVSVRKDAQTVYYRLASEDVVKIIMVLQSIYCPE